MENAVIVKVAVSAAPYSIDKPYDYLTPGKMAEDARPGIRVIAPFGRGNRTCEGIILAREEGEKRPGLKPLIRLLDREPVLDQAGIALALWLRQRYFCTMFEAVRTILPAGLWYRLREVWHLSENWSDVCRSPAEEEVVQALLEAGGSVGLEALEERCGQAVGTLLHAMEKSGIVTCETFAQRKIQDKTRRMAELTGNAQELLTSAKGKQRLSPQRKAVMELLSSSGRLSTAEVCYFTGVSARLLKTMEKDALLVLTEEEELRVPQVLPTESEPFAPLSEEQEHAFQTLRAYLGTGKPEAALLQGVTGSGKTQVYLHLARETLRQGRNVIVLVPEIALTPQMMERFSACFGGQAALFHSGLRLTERYDQWKRVRRGEVRVVLGTRSAIFVPLSNLGLVVLDEEQESSYQSENAPPYHARDVAKFLCARNQALLVLGSATPSVESAWSAEQGIYHSAQLTQRYNGQALPFVKIADLREEIRRGNPGLIGQELQRELEENLCRGEQSILFLNRRGSSRMLLCGECGHVPECPRCSVPLTYHSANGRLMCHYCGHSQRVFEACPKCGGLMKRIGVGTQKVEEELKELFPKTKLLRMDADTASGGQASILRRFEQEKIPILLGTQMVAKGLDFGNVTLAGVLLADMSLYVDSYRAAERTFSLLAQVAGRAGRGERPGRAVIQTYTPENDVIQCAARQDYRSFYEGEIRLRRLRNCPPFADVFTFTVSGFEEGKVLHAATMLRERLRQLFLPDQFAERPKGKASASGQARLPRVEKGPLQLLGPAPAPILKLNNRYRYRVILIGRNDAAARGLVSGVLKEFAQIRTNRGLYVYVDCNGMD